MTQRIKLFSDGSLRRDMDKSRRTVQDLHGTSINPVTDIGLARVGLEGLVGRLEGLAGRKVLIAVSGGVDSTTTAVLLRTAGADGTQLMIDTGFLRQDEPAAPVLDLEGAGLRVEVVDERQRFHEAMQGKKTGAERRDAFRDVYFDVLADFMRVRDIDVIAQGTQFHQIVAKQAHNEPTRRFLDNKFEVVEPVAGLTKSQIRVLARALGVPDKCVTRRPFPGPGLILRFGGEYTHEKLELIRAATHVVDTFVHSHAEDFTECYQIFPYLTDQEPVTYVDHSGAGSYGAVLLLRAVREEFHGRTIVYRPFTVPDRLSGGLVERLMAIPGIARVCWDLTPKFGSGVDVAPGATIEYA